LRVTSTAVSRLPRSVLPTSDGHPFFERRIRSWRTAGSTRSWKGCARASSGDAWRATGLLPIAMPCSLQVRSRRDQAESAILSRAVIRRFIPSPADRSQPTHTSFKRTSILPTDSAEDLIRILALRRTAAHVQDYHHLHMNVVSIL